MSRKDNSTPNKIPDIDRRKLLALTSGALAGVAGCGGGGGGTDSPTPSPTPTSTDEKTPGTGLEESSPSPTESPTPKQETDGQEQDTATPEPELVDPQLDLQIGASWNPKTSTAMHFYTPSRSWPWWWMLVYRGAITWPSFNGPQQLWMLKDLETSDGGCTVTLTFKENYTWWDGTPVTADDYLVDLMLNVYRTYNGPENAPYTWEKVDDYTLRQTRDNPINAGSAAATEHQGALYAKDDSDYHAGWLEKYKDATSSDEIASVTNEIANTKVTFDQFVNDGLGAGLFKPTKWDATEVVAEKFDQHPRADMTNLKRVRHLIHPDAQKANAAMKQGLYEIGDANQLGLVPKVPDVEVFRSWAFTGFPKLVLNFHNEHLAKRRVRQAIGYMQPTKQVAKINKKAHGIRSNPRPYNIGMSPTVAPSYLSDSFLNKMIIYGAEPKMQKANQMMKEAGYSKQGGKWVDNNGKTPSLRYTSPSWPSYKTIAKTFKNSLENFGFNVKLLIGGSGGFSNRFNQSYKFDLANWFGNALRPAGYYTIASAAGLDNYMPSVAKKPTAKGGGCSPTVSPAELAQPRSERLGHKIHGEFPSTVGTDKPLSETDTQQFLPIKWHKELGTAQSRSAVVERVRKLAWWYNYKVPHLTWYQEVWTHWGNTKKFNFADADNPEAWSQACEMQLKGLVDSKVKQ